MKKMSSSVISQVEIKMQCVIGPSPIPTLTCPDTAVLGLRRFRHGPLPAGTIHNVGYGFTSGILPCAPAGPWTRGAHGQNRNAHGRAGAAQHMDVRKAASRRFCQSRPAFICICPASECRATVSRMTASGILSCGKPTQYAGGVHE